MQWKFDGNAPIYTQLVDQMKLGIVSGEWIPGQRIPAVRELAVDAGVNPNTMQRALQELERQGLMFSQRTSGRFVTEDREMIEDAKRTLANRHISAFIRQMQALGYTRQEIVAMLEESERGEEHDANS
ncbi:MAG: GntR family transcriptional regulator [Oscillospiraceae bacterium]|nr:GntR family transcriptional regulator [Oscillospiraceae bacterium]